MSGIFKSARIRSLLRRKMRSYLGYAVGEIVLVVLGILIALQINNCNNDRLAHRAELQAYRNLKRQLLADRQELDQVIDFNRNHSDNIQNGLRIIRSADRTKIDTLAFLTMGLSWYSDFFGGGNPHEAMVNNGEIRLMQNADIPRTLQRLAMTYVFIDNLEQKNWDIIMQEFSPEVRGAIDYAEFRPVDTAALFSVEIKNIFTESLYVTAIKDSIYLQATHEIDSIVGLIDEELAEIR